MTGASGVHAQLAARLCRLLAPRHLLLAGTQDEALCRSLATEAVTHEATLHVATRHKPEWLADLRAQAEDRLIVHEAAPADVAGVIPLPDLAWLDDDANWFTVHGLLATLHRRAERFGRPYPLTLIAGAGWPSARRDSYADPQAIPAAHRHAHERAGLVPGRPAPGSGLYADRFNAVAENEPGTGVLTAIEDFLAGRAGALRLTLLPGFGGLAALCSRSGPAAEAFAPAALVPDVLAMAQALETERLTGAVDLAAARLALRHAEDLIGKLRANTPAPAPAPAAPALPAAPPAEPAPAAAPQPPASPLLPLKRRLAALLPGRAAKAGQEEDSQEQAALDRLRASPIFDAAWYNATYNDVAEAGADPALHYLRDGAAELRDPGPYFSSGYYLTAYPDVAAEKLNPLLHYLASGAAEGRNPGLHFATRHYLEAHPEAAQSGLNPLEHYLSVGRPAGWQAPSVEP